MSVRPFVIGLLVVVAACSGGSEKKATPGTEPPSTTTLPGATTSTLNATNATAPKIPATTVAEEADVPTGKSFGFITAFEGESAASFDLASYFTGKEAAKAAAEDGVIKPGESVPNDYYIRNKNPKLRTIKLGNFVVVNVSDCSDGPCKTVKSDLKTLKTRPTPVPVWINVFKGNVLQIDEQYRP